MRGRGEGATGSEGGVTGKHVWYIMYTGTCEVAISAGSGLLKTEGGEIEGSTPILLMERGGTVGVRRERGAAVRGRLTRQLMSKKIAKIRIRISQTGVSVAMEEGMGGEGGAAGGMGRAEGNAHHSEAEVSGCE